MTLKIFAAALAASILAPVATALAENGGKCRVSVTYRDSRGNHYTLVTCNDGQAACNSFPYTGYCFGGFGMPDPGIVRKDCIWLPENQCKPSR